MTKVLDASALLVYLEKGPGYEKVQDALVRAAGSERKLLMSVVNWGEVYYILVRGHGSRDGEKVIQLIETFPIEFVSADLELTRQAALYKVVKKLPYADCFAASLAKIRKVSLMTADKDFKQIHDEVEVEWIL